MANGTVVSTTPTGKATEKGKRKRDLLPKGKTKAYESDFFKQK